MLGVGRFGSILGSFLGGLLLTMGWSFSAVIGILAMPAIFAALSIVASRSAARSALA
jgi:AAHS family 4-hydroxybenzoate transporter-like MFS transporter